MSYPISNVDNASNAFVLTSFEQTLVFFGDVVDVSHLRDIPALRELKKTAGIARSHRLQKQIEQLEMSIPTIEVAAKEIK